MKISYNENITATVMLCHVLMHVLSIFVIKCANFVEC